MLRAVVLAGCLVAPSWAQAQDPEPANADPLAPIAVRSWSAPAGCPGSEALITAIRAELAAAPPSGLVALAVGVVIARRTVDGGEFVLRLRIDAPGGTDETVRELRGSTCQGVIDAAALTLAMAVESAEAIGNQQITVVAPPSPRPSGPAPEVVYRDRQRALKASVRVGFHSEIGLLPGAALAMEVGAAGEVGPWRGEIGVGYWFERRTAEEGPASLISILAAPIRACYRVAHTLAFSPCLGLELGVFQARGADVQQTRTGSAFYGAAVVSASIGLRVVGPWWLRAHTGASILVRRPHFVVLPDRELYAPALVSARFILLSEVLF